MLTKDDKYGRIIIVRTSAEKSPFPEDMFELVTAVEACYFWPEIAANLKEIRRVLKSGGSLLLII